MLSSILILAGALVLLVGGADLLIRGASTLAAAAGVPALMVGMTVVAFGTSAPEIVINTLSAAHGETGLAFGNIVGACAINLGFVLAVTAIIRPMPVEVSIVSREIPMMLLAATAFAVMSADRMLDGAASDVLSRTNGIVLLLLFCVFIYYTANQFLHRRTGDAFVAAVHEAVESETVAAPLPRKKAGWADVAMTIGGLAAVAVGGRLTVSSAVEVATALGVSQVIIGLTLLSFGTTLPELTTSLLAARRGQSDIALGNVVGSNILNLLLIGGLVATICPVPVPAGGQFDQLFLCGLSAVLLPIAIRGPRRITRGEGVLLLASYLTYVTIRTSIAFAGRGPV